MNKKAWPYIGSSDSDMGVKTYGDFRDMAPSSPQRGDGLTPEKHTSEDSGTQTSRRLSGKQPALSNDPMEDNDLFESAFSTNFADDNLNILMVSDDCDSIEEFASLKHNFFHISKTSQLDNDNIVSKKADPRYYNYNKKFDLFIINNKFDNDNFKLSIANITSQLKNNAKGFIKTHLKSSDVFSILSNFNINVDYYKNNLYKVSFNNLKNTNIVGVMDKTGFVKATFICDIADSFERKIAGLQAYSAINKSFGLYFPYKKATDVSYHMGTVNYPIDIIFLDNELTIKKIDKNIQPGTPGLFSCGGVKSVLEINGNMCDVLDLKVGDQVFIDSAENLNSKSIEKNIAIKNSNEKSSLKKYGSVSVKTIGKNEIVKTAFNLENNNYCIVDIDNYLDLKVIASEIKEYDKYLLTQNVFGPPKTAGINKEKYSLYKIATGAIPNNFFVPSTIKGFNDFINKDISDDFKKLIRFNGKIIFASRHDLNNSLLHSFFDSYSRIISGTAFPKFDLIKIASDIDLYSAISQKYNNGTLYFLNKKAGTKIPKQIADKAKEAEEGFKKAKEEAEDLVENLKINLKVYQGIEADKEKIKNSKFEYRESVERNQKILKDSLVKIRDSIKIMNEIKDISTTSEIIGTIANSSTRFSTIVAEIFDLQDIIESEDFLTELSSKTLEIDKIFIDLKNSIQRMISFINNDILGILVISL